jgi:DNA-binding CsgD family transcriptional regulator
MVALTPVLHEIIPHGWSRWALLDSSASISSGHSENPETTVIFGQRMWRFTQDPSSPMALWMPSFRAKGIGWTLHMQGRGWLDSGWYREIESPLDSCWILDAMIGDARGTFALLVLTRPRSATPFTVDDVQRLDRLRPWLAHALRRNSPGDMRGEDQTLPGAAGAPVLSGQMILTSDGNPVYQTAGLDFLLKRVLENVPASYTKHAEARAELPAPILKLMRCLAGAATGTSAAPPRMQVPAAHGVVTLEAKWLIPAGATAADAAKDPQSCLVSVTVELREHAIAYAARALRENGATPAQVKVGVRLAAGMTKRMIADELGIRLSSVLDLTKKLYQNLDIHNPAELSARIWLARSSSEGGRPPPWAIETSGLTHRKDAASAVLR